MTGELGMTPTGDTLEGAREAVRHRSWSEACAFYTSLDEDALAPEDLEAKADALWWTSQIEASTAVRQKAYAGYSARGDRARAAYAAWFISLDYDMKGEPAVASGWSMRAKRDVAGQPPSTVHGLLALADAREKHMRGDLDAALQHATDALELGNALGDTNLLALATQTIGRVLISAGRVEEGTTLLDEAMTSVVAGLIDPLFTGAIYCDVLSTCVEIGDIPRAAEWTAAAARWYEQISASSPFHGLCRVHRVEVA
ncbi:MAG TPA: LuxR family transcriptional regulator, partial [Actinomycetota bacterium]|nr:LuxR family transcriptional regulator [Actinomycetota bacterium]